MIWAEVHDLPHLDDAGKKIAWLPMVDYRFGRHTDAFREEGAFTIPSAYARINEIHNVDPSDHANDVGSIVHFYQREVLGGDSKPIPVGSMVVERRPDELQSRATSTTQFSGRGLTSFFLDRMKLLPFDHPKQPTAQPDWNFGAPEGGGLLQNPSFEESGFPNGGFEDGTADGWSTEFGGTIAAVLDAVQALTGDYYGLWNTAGDGSRLKVSLTGLTIGATYTVTGSIDDLGGSGERVRVGVTEATNATHTQAYFDDDTKIWWAEIANAASGAGSTTGVYQTTTLTFVAGANSCEIIFEYKDSNDHNLAIDNWTISGKTVGLGAWKVGYAPGTLNIAAITTEQAHTGTQSLKMQGTQPPYVDAFGRFSYVALRVFQDVSLIPGRIYTGTIWVRHAGPGDKIFVLRMTRLTPQGPLEQTTLGGLLPGPGSYDMAAQYFTVPANTWTQLSISAIADTIGIRFSGAWAGAIYPPASLGTLTSPTFFWDTASLYEGLPAVTIGNVWGMIQGDRLSWLVPTFTATEDSNGDPWDMERTFTLSEGDSWGQIAESFQRLWGYTHRIRYDREDNTYYFDIFNPGHVEFDHSTTDTGSLTVGMNILGGDLVTRTPEATSFRATTEDGVWVEGVDEDLLDAWGEAEFFLDVPEVGTTADITAVIDRAMARNLEEMTTFQAQMGTESQVVPFRDINVYDMVQVNLGARNPIPVDDKMVTSIVCSGKPGQMPDYQVYVSSDAFASTGAAALAEAVRRLLRKRDKPETIPLTPPFTSGSGGAPTVVVAASDATDLSKSKADFWCTGTDDHLIVQQAIDLIDSGGTDGGTLWLTEGNFYFDGSGGDATFAFATDITIRGMGRPSPLDTGTSIHMVNTNSGSRGFAGGGEGGVNIRDLGFFGEGLGTAISLGGGRVSNVYVENFEVGVELDVAQLDNSVIQICEYDVFCDQRVTIFNNLLGAAFGFTAYGIGGFCGSGSMIYNNIFGDAGDDPVSSSFLGAIYLDQAADHTIIAGNQFWLGGNDPGIALFIYGAYNCIIANNYFDLGRADGIVLDNSLNVVQNNIIQGNSLHMEFPEDDNAYDGIRIDGDDNLIQHNLLRGSNGADQPRYGINIASGDDNIVVGNDLRPLADWATDAINDAGSGTQLFYPSDGAYGDNFTGTGGGGGGGGTSIATFSQAGTLVTGSGVFKMVFPVAATIIGVQIAVAVSPTGDDLIVDVHKNGTTIFTTQANRPIVADADADGVGAEATPDVTSISAGEYLTVDIDQIGSTIAGEDLVVSVEYQA